MAIPQDETLGSQLFGGPSDSSDDKMSRLGPTFPGAEMTLGDALAESDDSASDADSDDDSDGGDFEVLGGRECAIGGWVDYEADRREAAHASNAAHQIVANATGGDASPFGDAQAGSDASAPSVTGLDAAMSLLSAVPGAPAPTAIGGAPASGGAPDIPHAAAASRRLHEALTKLEVASMRSDWWEVHDRISLPAADLAGLADDIEAAGSATPEQLTALTAATEIAAANAPPELCAPELQRSVAVQELVAQSLSERKKLKKVPLGRATRADLRRLERAALPYARRVEVLSARVAAAAERTADLLRRAVEG